MSASYGTEGAIPLLQLRIRGFRQSELLDRLVFHLQELQNWTKQHEKVDQLDIAIASGGLVLKESEQNGFWAERALDRLPPKQFLLFWRLAEKARHHRMVGIADVYSDGEGDSSSMSSLVARLRQALPAELRSLIVAVNGHTGCYCLKLETSKIHLFPGS